MARQIFNANELTYTISPDTDPPAGDRTWALLRAQLRDEITGEPPRGGVYVDSPQLHLTPRVAEGGLVGFAGIPSRAFPLLATQSRNVPVTIRADGYVTVQLNPQVVSIPGFPGAFATTDLGIVELHRLPTVILGRVMFSTGTAQTGIGGATVTLTGLWRTPSPANVVLPPPDPPNIVSLQPAVYFGRAAAGSQVVGQDFKGVPGPEKHLLEDAPAQQLLLRLSDRIQIAKGDILAIDPQDAERAEYIVIQSIAGASTDDQPATVTLAYPLRLVHRRGATAHKVQFQQVGLATPLASDVIPGDTCIFPGAAGNLGAAPLAAIQGGGGPTEYHAVSYFTATTNAQGNFRLPPVSRVAQCQFRVHDGAHPDLINVLFTPDYTSGESRLDFVYQ